MRHKNPMSTYVFPAKRYALRLTISMSRHPPRAPQRISFQHTTSCRPSYQRWPVPSQRENLNKLIWEVGKRGISPGNIAEQVVVCCCIVSLAIYILFCAVGSYTSRSRFNRGQSFRANDVYGPLRSCLYIRVRFYRVNTLGVLSGMKKGVGLVIDHLQGL